MKKATIAALALFLMSAFGTAIAEDVILVSDKNYADAMIAGVVSNKIGASVFVIEGGQISSEIMSGIQDISPENVYIFGGPAVISEDVEDSLNDYSVTRIFGMTRIGTAAEVARFFWPDGAENAVIVEDEIGDPENGNPCLAMLARDFAASKGHPLLFVSGEEISNEVSDVLEDLNMTNGSFMGTGTQIRTRLQNALGTLESFEGDCTQLKEQIMERVRERIENRWGNNTPLVVIAVGNWSNYIEAPAVPKGRSILVWSADEISSVVEEVKQANYSKLFVLGKPELAQQIADAFEAENITIDRLSGKPAEVAMQVRNKLNETISEIRGNWEETREQWKDAIRDRWDSIVERCNQTIHQIRAIRKIAPEVDSASISQAIEAYNNGDYEIAIKECNELIQLKNNLVWRYRNALNRTLEELVSSEILGLDSSEIENSLSRLYSSLTNSPSLVSVSRMNPSAISGSSDCVRAMQSAKNLYQNGRYNLARQAYNAAKTLCS